MKHYLIFLVVLPFFLCGCKKKYPKDGNYILEIIVEGVTKKTEGKIQHTSSSEFSFFSSDPQLGHTIDFKKNNSQITGVAVLYSSGNISKIFDYTGQIKYSYYHLVINGDYIENLGTPTQRNGKFKIYRKRF